MWNKSDWERFRNSSKIKDLPPQEQARQYFLRQSDRMMESSFTNAVAASSAAGAGGGTLRKNISAPEAPATLLTFVENNTIHIVVGNYKTGILSEPINTGIVWSNGESTSYIQNTQNIAHNKGFMVIIYDAIHGRTYAFFIDVNGNLVDSIYTGGSYQYGDLDYQGAWFADFEPDGQATTEIVFKMFDGVNVTTNNFNGFSDIGVGTDIGRLLGDAGAVITLTNLSGVRKTGVVKWNGIYVELFTQEEGIEYRFLSYWYSNILLSIKYNQQSGLYTTVEKWTWTGSEFISEETDLSLTPIDWYADGSLYGENRAILLFGNLSDSDQPWTIYQTNSEGSRLDQTPKGNFNSYTLWYKRMELYQPSNLITNSAGVFFHSGGNYSNEIPNDFELFDNFKVCWYDSVNVFHEQIIVENAAEGESFAIGWDSGDNGGLKSVMPMFYGFDPTKGNNVSFYFLGRGEEGGFLPVDSGLSPSEILNMTTYAISPVGTVIRSEIAGQPSSYVFVLRTHDDVIVDKSVSNNYDWSNTTLNTLLAVDNTEIGNSFAWSPATGVTNLDFASSEEERIFVTFGYDEVRNYFATSTGFQPGVQVIAEKIRVENNFEYKSFYLFDNDNGFRGPFNLRSIGGNCTLGETVFYHRYSDVPDITTYDVYSLASGDLINSYNVENENTEYIYGDRFLVDSFSPDSYRPYVAKLSTNGNLLAPLFNPPLLAGGGGPVFKILKQPDGKFLVAGSNLYQIGYNEPASILRFNSNGTLDTSFQRGDGGASINAIDLEEDGSIIVGGSFASWNGFAVNNIARLNSDGSLDETFLVGETLGASGTVLVVKVQPDGKILVGGEFIKFNNIEASHITRIDEQGVIDETFDTGTGFNSRVCSIELLFRPDIAPDYDILVGGDFNNYNSIEARKLVNLGMDGSLQYEFSLDNEVRVIRSAPGNESFYAGGSFTSFVFGSPFLPQRVGRFIWNGVPDPLFNTEDGFNDLVRDIVVQYDGKVVAVGYFTNYRGSLTPRIARLNTDGSLDESFVTGIGFDNAGESVIEISAEEGSDILAGGYFFTYQEKMNYNFLTSKGLLEQEVARDFDRNNVSIAQNDAYWGWSD